MRLWSCYLGLFSPPWCSYKLYQQEQNPDPCENSSQLQSVRFIDHNHIFTTDQIKPITQITARTAEPKRLISNHAHTAKSISESIKSEKKENNFSCKKMSETDSLLLLNQSK